jgi:PPR repeat
MFQMMLELYVRANLLTNARELVKKELPRSIEAHCYLLKAYCDQNQLQVATRMLFDLLQNINTDDPRLGIIPNAQMFNIVMEGWGKSKNIDDAYEQISMLFDTVRNHPICQQYKIRPNKYTYIAVLESLISFEVPDGAVKAETMLGEMEQTYNSTLFTDNPNQAVDVNELVKPDVDIYMLVMKAWIQSSDCDRALEILRRMEKFTDIVPDKQMYYEILNYYAKVGSEKAAESAEQIFKLMKASYEPQFHSYCLLNRAWLKSGSAKATDKLWLLYCEMTERNMRPDQPMYLQLIQSLTAKRELSYVRKAQIVLNDIEEYNSKYLVPTHYTMMIMAYLELDEIDYAIEILSKFVHKFGRRDHQLVPIMTQLIKLWIDKGQYKKATMLVNTMQEFSDTGLLQEGVKRDVFELLKTAWESSDDPDKDFIIGQIDDIIRHLTARRPTDASTSTDTTAMTNDTTGSSTSSSSSSQSS